MRVVLQRVQSAQVEVAGEVVGEIAGTGLLALVGITHHDTQETVEKLVHKMLGLRIFEGEKSAVDIKAPVLAVSQFTLYAQVKRGRRPSWSEAAPAAVSEPLFNYFVEYTKSQGTLVETGLFGANMQVSLINDGPVTIIIDSDDL